MDWDLERFHEDGTRVCSMADALLFVGDRWSLHAVREIGSGVRRFDAIQRRTGAPREVLTSRLRKLESRGVITRTLYSQRPPRYDYVLTAAGEELIPIMGALYAWGEKYATPKLVSEETEDGPSDKPDQRIA